MPHIMKEVGHPINVELHDRTHPEAAEHQAPCFLQTKQLPVRWRITGRRSSLSSPICNVVRLSRRNRRMLRGIAVYRPPRGDPEQAERTRDEKPSLPSQSL